MNTFEYVVFIYDGVDKTITVPFKPAKLDLGLVENNDMFNFLGGLGYHLHTYTAINNEIVYIFEKVVNLTLTGTGTLHSDFEVMRIMGELPSTEPLTDQVPDMGKIILPFGY